MTECKECMGTGVVGKRSQSETDGSDCVSIVLCGCVESRMRQMAGRVHELECMIRSIRARAASYGINVVVDMASSVLTDDDEEEI